ncbi:MAG: bifunctional hydroxymethylpyrimidine kinase/phosphomethylpyrimidine kinase [Verrucomicrobiota bacterium]|nr:bifunctional hydroxymethylpyrimidine kinase/phosphomethylpyrimidine kinase [Verrucomicrobiota bacterium]
MKRPRRTPVAMTIAGSDSGGGAGIQADLKTFQALGVFGASAVTCLTAQNPDEVTRVAAVDPGMVAEQIRAICRGFPVAAAKTGMLYSAGIVRAVAREVRKQGIRKLVVDPVIIATSGARLLKEEAVAVLCRRLIPLATVVTPNLPEAEMLWGRRIRSLDDMKAAARGIGERFGVACVCKGGHLWEAARVQGSGFRVEGGARPPAFAGLRRGAPDERSWRRSAGRGRHAPPAETASQTRENAGVADVLYAGGRTKVFVSARVVTRETHGTGCAFSAALAAFLAMGFALPEAVRKAKGFVAAALVSAIRTGKHLPMWIDPLPA